MCLANNKIKSLICIVAAGTNSSYFHHYSKCYLTLSSNKNGPFSGNNNCPSTGHLSNLNCIATDPSIFGVSDKGNLI